DSIRVRIVEREPRVVVRTNAGRLRWVDEDAVFLGEMSTADQMPAFFLRGLSEDDSETAQVENVERVRRFIQFERECVATGIAERVSEVNLSDVRDVRVQLSGEDSQIEVRLGSEEAGKRLKSGLEVLDGQRRTPRGQYISYVDLSQGKRAVIGFVSGAHVATAAGSATDNVPLNRSAASQRSNQASGSDEQKKKEKKEKNKREAG
ncbi:MAG TPA: cell division protein FtsQ/DivIB, partial [Pyrinomonadaceae bacterium]|nr:cell division protein FtsQ/DivIB [Pyrinomonadaceae bacterium]